MVTVKLGQKMAAYFFQGAAEAILQGPPPSSGDSGDTTG
jgi:hypothetical protein